MASTEVDIRDNRELRRVEAVSQEGEVAGFAEYRIHDGDVFEFTHTEVDERFEGQGIGSRLAAGVLDFVRDESATIVPTCSFIRSYLDKHEESQDLLAAGDPQAGDPHAEDDQGGEKDPAKP